MKTNDQKTPYDAPRTPTGGAIVTLFVCVIIMAIFFGRFIAEYYFNGASQP